MDFRSSCYLTAWFRKTELELYSILEEKGHPQLVLSLQEDPYLCLIHYLEIISLETRKKQARTKFLSYFERDKFFKSKYKNLKNLRKCRRRSFECIGQRKSPKRLDRRVTWHTVYNDISAFSRVWMAGVGGTNASCQLNFGHFSVVSWMIFNN